MDFGLRHRASFPKIAGRAVRSARGTGGAGGSVSRGRAINRHELRGNEAGQAAPVHAKKVTAAFDGGRLTSNGGVMLLAMAERRLGLAARLARVSPDRRDPTRIVHSLADMFRARMFAICCGYEDADDLDHLRFSGKIHTDERVWLHLLRQPILMID